MVVNDIPSLAKFILSDDCKSIAFLTGAGVSVASGIPDFRSPGGMYSSLRPDLLSATPQQKRLMAIDPTNVVSWQMFQENSLPYMEVRRPFILGAFQQTWKATIAHRFMELLHQKTNKLTRVYTQNVDGLDSQCLPRDKVVPVHGTNAQAACEGCGTEIDLAKFCKLVKTNIKDIYATNESDIVQAERESKPIHCPTCNRALVKPKIVMFGRPLPEEFFTQAQEDLPNVDLLIVAGTSLEVSPANTLVYKVPDSTIRVIVNREPVGQDLGIDYTTCSDIKREFFARVPRDDEFYRTIKELGWTQEFVEYDESSSSSKQSKRDFFAQGDCDAIFFQLIQALGWTEDLEAKIDLLPEKSKALLQSMTKEEGIIE
jgi:NAD-dependent deacetylase sirtuin 2